MDEMYVQRFACEAGRWTALAEKQGISLAELVRESVEAAIARGSSR